MRKGIILAGGSGSRLYPLTFSITKQLLPIHDKPMIYYPLATLLNLDIKDILIISTLKDKGKFETLLGHGEDLGIKISYETQTKPNGIAEGLIIAEKFLSGQSCVFILGDNLFIGSFFSDLIRQELLKKEGATIFSYKVNDPERYGIVSYNVDGCPNKIIEKPKYFVSNNAITGIYFYDPKAVEIAKSLKPSARNELEISDINKHYLTNKLLKVINLDDNITWLDAGTISSMYEASSYIDTIEKRTGKKVGCIEEIAFNRDYITINQLKNISLKYGSSEYGLYLKEIIRHNSNIVS
jgi:glucose-1-phosphate thymidylyltransferase